MYRMAAKIRGALDRALRRAEISPADGAAVTLARHYADAIDADGDLIKLGPALLAAMVQLRMTPKARTSVMEGGPAGGGQRDPLDELDARRAARQRPS